MKTTGAINAIAEFCGPRDISTLTSSAVKCKYGIKQVDVAILFGGSIIAGGDVFAQAIQNKIARHYMIVGGHGHTTPKFRQKIQELFPNIKADRLSEAELFQEYLKRKHQLQAELLEIHSTNCGNNITLALEMLGKHKIEAHSFLLIQDASMQRRMAAGLRKFSPDAVIVNYAAYQAHVGEINGELAFDEDIPGMWEMSDYLSLIMGEIPRLQDSPNGYGPAGKNYIAHVDVPQKVEQAFDFLASQYPALVRQANPEFATKAN